MPNGTLVGRGVLTVFSALPQDECWRCLSYLNGYISTSAAFAMKCSQQNTMTGNLVVVPLYLAESSHVFPSVAAPGPTGTAAEIVVPLVVGQFHWSCRLGKALRFQNGIYPSYHHLSARHTLWLCRNSY